MGFFGRLLRKGTANAEGQKQVQACSKSPKDEGYLISSEVDLLTPTKGTRWHRSTSPKLERETNSYFGPPSLPGKHISFVDLQAHVRLFGLLTLTMWSSKDRGHAAGAVKVSSTSEQQLIDHIRRITGESIVYQSACFLYPEYPIIYTVVGIPLGNGEVTLLRSVANC